MHEVSLFENVSRNLEGDLLLTFRVESKPELLEEVKKMKDEKLVLDVKKYRKARSLDANAYFWQLLSRMAEKLHTNKDTLYLLMLKRYGVFVDMAIKQEALETLENAFRFVEKFKDGISIKNKDLIAVRCYFGSSSYNVTEMQALINGTVEEAKDLGVEVLSSEEIDRILSVWKGK